MTPCLNPACNTRNAPDAKFCMKCGTKLKIQDRYKPTKELGAGAFGKTFLAEDSGMPYIWPCVIKQFIFTSPNANDVATAKKFFYDEAKQLQKLGQHPQIPQLLSFCEQEIPKQKTGKEETFLCLIQEFIDGENLLEELNEHGVFSEAKIRQVLTDLLPVLEFIHGDEHRVIHRDIKPENIMRRRSNQKLVLIDFGVARQTSATSLKKTDTIFAGSPGYASPEQAAQQTIFSSDIYSLGVTCLVLLTGVDPTTLYDIHEGGFRWRHFLINNPVSDSLGRVLDEMTQGAVKHRYKSAQEVLQALNPPAPKIIIPPTPKVSTPIPATPIIQTPIVAGRNFTENIGGGGLFKSRVELEMIAIPGSSFQMGDQDFDSTKPLHLVNIKPFYLGKYPVTQEQYQAIMGENPSYFKGAELPVDSVSWHKGVEFCRRLSQKTGKNYRLPSEAEWEYACRAGTQTKYYFGDDEKQLGNYAWYRDSSNGKTHPVGQKQPNRFGLYDMHGNVWEWCSDRWHPNYDKAPTDGSPWETGTVDDYRVLRGGSWDLDAVYCRSAVRYGYSAGGSGSSIGFRVALASF